MSPINYEEDQSVWQRKLFKQISAFRYGKIQAYLFYAQFYKAHCFFVTRNGGI